MDDDEQSHRFHIHINDFQVMSVNGQPYNAHGLQDTVVLPGHGEVVIRIPFDDFAGRSVYHCHTLIHGNSRGNRVGESVLYIISQNSQLLKPILKVISDIVYLIFKVSK